MNREDYYPKFENVNIHCFDLMKYRRLTSTLNYSVFANYNNQSYFSGNIIVDTESFAQWNGNAWELFRGQDVIKTMGLQQITDFLIEKDRECSNKSIEN